MQKSTNILITKSEGDYELLDSGQGEKLERFVDVVLFRPDPQALWDKRLPESKWKSSDGYFTREESKGDWSLKKTIPDRWSIELAGLKLYVKPTPFKHVGLFPEQVKNWEWLNHVIKPDCEVLNLFGYTGGATLIAAKAGAKVVHVDSSKVAINWARDNAELSGLKDKPVRWILDDARTFVRRELKRGRKYDGIIMDPPAFGHGPEGELWKIEEDFLSLVDDCFKLLKNEPLFFLMSGYSAGYSALAYENILLTLRKKFGGNIEIGELAIQESEKISEETFETRLLPCGIFARWSK